MLQAVRQGKLGKYPTRLEPLLVALLRRLGQPGEARTAYQRALELTHDERERRFLQRRLAAL